MTVSHEQDILAGYDEEQVRLMAEMCIQVDNDDKPIGGVSKKDAHIVENINKGILHRAFSVFLFDTQGRLLLQQRASEKITFPDMWTNTCCSHPLCVADELVMDDNQTGVKTAAIRKLEHELGIPPSQVPMEDFTYLTRIHYLAPSDGFWGEHEIDYILFIQKDVTLAINPNEVRDYKYVTKAELQELFATADKTGAKITPWFGLICETFLYKWWDNLENVKSMADPDTIHRMSADWLASRRRSLSAPSLLAMDAAQIGTQTHTGVFNESVHTSNDLIATLNSLSRDLFPVPHINLEGFNLDKFQHDVLSNGADVSPSLPPHSPTESYANTSTTSLILPSDFALAGGRGVGSNYARPEIPPTSIDQRRNFSPKMLDSSIRSPRRSLSIQLSHDPIAADPTRLSSNSIDFGRSPKSSSANLGLRPMGRPRSYSDLTLGGAQYVGYDSMLQAHNNMARQQSMSAVPLETMTLTSPNRNRESASPTENDDFDFSALDREFGSFDQFADQGERTDEGQAAQSGPMGRRQMHVLSEKKRRQNLKEKFDELVRLVPHCREKTSKVDILQKTTDYIYYLKKQIEKVHLENVQLKQNYAKVWKDQPALPPSAFIGGAAPAGHWPRGSIPMMPQQPISMGPPMPRPMKIPISPAPANHARPLVPNMGSQPLMQEVPGQHMRRANSTNSLNTLAGLGLHRAL